MNTTDASEFADDQVAEKIIAECLRSALPVYFALLENDKVKTSREMGNTIRHLATCLQESSFNSFAEDEDDDPDGGEEVDEMERFYAEGEDD